MIKASDFTDNAAGIIHITGPKLSKLADKYDSLVPALRELILCPDTPPEADVKDMIANRLDATQGRFAAIVGPGAAGARASGPVCLAASGAVRPGAFSAGWIPVGRLRPGW